MGQNKQNPITGW